MRGTPADAPKIVRLFDEVAVRTPDTEYDTLLWLWAEEVTRLLAKVAE